MTLDDLVSYKLENFAHTCIVSNSAVTTECTFQHYVPCVDLQYISSLGAFIRALLSHT